MEKSLPKNLLSAVILDDHKLFSNTFASFLERLGIFRQVHYCHEIPDCIPLLAQLTTTSRIYLFLDYQLETTTTLHLISESRRISQKIKTIITSSITNPYTVNNILRYSPNGFLSKLSGTEIILECVNTIEQGQQYLCPVIKQLRSSANNEPSTPFSIRETEILQYFAQGFSIAETAEKINLSRHTIVNHRSNMMKKSGTKSIVDLLAFARKTGYI